ncbi:MAG: hypothetical protein HYU80_00535 [Candidatus Blackburnbacteria bacterium]|nr:hypothetical protein [Candidatus Blackburnbacteria bacterium]
MAEVPRGAQEGREVYPPSDFGLAQRGIDRIEKISQDEITTEDMSAWHGLRRERARLFAEPEVAPALGAAKIALGAALERALDEGKGGALGVATYIQKNRASIHSEIRALVDPLLSSKPERHLGMGSWYVDRALDRMYATFAQRAGIDISNNPRLASALRPEDFEWELPENWEGRVGQRGPEPVGVGVVNGGGPRGPEPSPAGGGTEAGAGGPGGPREPGLPPSPLPRGSERGEAPREGRMFSLRWTRLHGLPDVLPPAPALGVNRSLSSSVVLSQIYESGFSQFLLRQAEVIVGSSEEDEFQAAVSSGLFPLMALDRAMRASRIDSVSETMRSSGPSPEGVSRWLRIDQETRRCLTLLLRLQGYEVADEGGVHDEVVNLQRVGHSDLDYLFPQSTVRLQGVGHRFSEVVGRNREGEIDPRSGITPGEISKYLEAVRQAVGVAPGVSTDMGVVRLAYTIFRYFGFPHANGKMLELYEELYDRRTGRGDLAYQDIRPLVDQTTVPDARKKLRDVLAEGRSVVTGERVGGVVAFAEALELIRQEQIVRDWADLQRLLDLKDAVSALREGRGPEAGRLEYDDRVRGLQDLMKNEFGILDVKRKLTDETVVRLKDPRKVSTVEPRGKPSRLQSEIAGFKGVLNDATSPVRLAEGIGSSVRRFFGVEDLYQKRRREREGRGR